MPDDAARRPRRRQALAWIALAAVLLVGSVSVAAGAFQHVKLPVYDWILYWSAGRLTLAGQDPYNGDNLYPFQKAEKPETEPPDTIIFYNPPWSLLFLLPFGLLPDFTAFRLVWGLLLLTMILFGAAWTWRRHGGPAESGAVALVVTFLFLPVLHVMQSGQIGPFVLLGIVGFLYFARRRQDWLAGAALLLAAVKPHLIALVWLALLLWAIDRGRWRILLGGALAGLGALAVALLFDPHLLQEYWIAMTQNSPSQQWITPTLGSGLRLAYRGLGLGEDWSPLQYVPTLLGFLALPVYYLSRRQRWDWDEQMPWLLLFSFLVAPYGAWVADMVVLLVPVLQASAWLWQSRPRWWPFAAAAYLGINGIAFWLSTRPVQTWWALWLPPTLLVGYFVVIRRLSALRAVAASAEH